MTMEDKGAQFNEMNQQRKFYNCENNYKDTMISKNASPIKRILTKQYKFSVTCICITFLLFSTILSLGIFCFVKLSFDITQLKQNFLDLQSDLDKTSGLSTIALAEEGYSSVMFSDDKVLVVTLYNHPLMHLFLVIIFHIKLLSYKNDLSSNRLRKFILN